MKQNPWDSSPRGWLLPDGRFIPLDEHACHADAARREFHDEAIPDTAGDNAIEALCMRHGWVHVSGYGDQAQYQFLVEPTTEQRRWLARNLREYTVAWAHLRDGRYGPEEEPVKSKGGGFHWSANLGVRQVPRENPIALRSVAEFKAYGKLVSDAYIAAPAFDASQVWRWKLLATHIEKMFKRIQTGRTGVRVEFVDHQPYASSKELREKVARTRVLQVSREGNTHSVFTPEQNLKFRAVHDYLTHIARGQGFTIKGEIAAYNTHRLLAPIEARPAFFTEVVGQALASITTRRYHPQKIALLPFDYENVGVEVARGARMPTRTNPLPPPARKPPENIIAAAERAWSVSFNRKPLGRGADGVVLRGSGSAVGIVAKFMYQTAQTKIEAALTDYIMQRQQKPATRTNAFRALFPAVIEGLIISDRLNNKWLVTLREDVEPLKYNKKLSDAAVHLWQATDAFAKMEDADDEELMERRMNTGMKELAEAELIAPEETFGLREAIEAVRDNGILLWDMHDGNWGVRFQKIPGYPPPGRMLAIDYGRSSLRDPDVAERALRLLRFHTATATNPPMTPPLELRSWRRIRA